MRIFKIILLFLSFCFVNIIVAQDKGPVVKSEEIRDISGENFYIHLVKKGHTLYSISKVYNVSIDEILLENPEAGNGLAIDQELLIPVISRETKVIESLDNTDYDFFYHVAREGETYEKIGTLYLVPGEHVRLVNSDLTEPLKEGEYVKVPVGLKISSGEPKATGPEIIEEKQAQATSPKYIIHIVKKQETLYRLSQLYNCKVEDIMALNPGLTHDISIGQSIKIPRKDYKQDVIADDKGNQQDKDETNIVEHKVQSGDNLYRIALYYKVSIDTIKLLNPGLTHEIRIGQVIKIPIDSTAKDYIFHKVDERKDKLNRIAKKYGLEVSEIREINPRLKNRVYYGQIIKIPVEYEEVAFVEPDTIPIIRIYDDIVADQDSIRIFKNIEKNLYRTYNVALMLPLYLEEVDSIAFDEYTETKLLLRKPPFHFLQFYEGFLIAVDSLRKEGLKLKLYVYDVDQEISKTIRVLQEPGLSEMDLIIGPLFNKSFELTSNFAKIFNINIVNPLTGRSEVLNKSPNVFKVQPSIEDEIDQVIRFVLDSYPDAKIILVRNDKFKHSSMVEHMQRSFSDSITPVFGVPNYVIHNILVERSQAGNEEFEDEEDLLASIQVEEKMFFRDDISAYFEDSTFLRNFVSEVVYMEDSIQGVINNASVVRENVLITLSDDRVFILDLLTNLNVLRDTFELRVVGLPNWEDFINYAPDLLYNTNTLLFTPGIIDYDNAYMKWFVKQFRNTYFTEPGEYACDGYDIGFYFLKALMTFGPDFQNFLSYHHPQLLQTSYYFDRFSFWRGYENVFWNILKIEDYELIEIPNTYFNKP